MTVPLRACAPKASSSVCTRSPDPQVCKGAAFLRHPQPARRLGGQQHSSTERTRRIKTGGDLPKVTAPDGKESGESGSWKSSPDQPPLATDRRLSLEQGRVPSKVTQQFIAEPGWSPDLVPARPAPFPDEAQLKRHPGPSPPSSLHTEVTHTPKGREKVPQPLLSQCWGPVWEG